MLSFSGIRGTGSRVARRRMLYGIYVNSFSARPLHNPLNRSHRVPNWQFGGGWPSAELPGTRDRPQSPCYSGRCSKGTGPNLVPKMIVPGYLQIGPQCKGCQYCSVARRIRPRSQGRPIMVDESRVVRCPNCENRFFYQLVRVRCPYCDKVMVFSLPEYEFHDGQIGCEHCHRKSHLRIGGYYSDRFGDTVATSEPVWIGGRPLSGGRLLSIEPAVPPELILVDSRKIPGEPRWNLESAVRCLEIEEFTAAAMLCRRCVQSALKIKGST